MFRFTRSDRYQNKDIHYFNAFAVKDRILSDQNVFTKTDIRPDQPLPTDLPSAILPTFSDDNDLMDQFTVLVSRILMYMPFFQTSFQDVVDWHISHPFEKEMSQKSEVVSQSCSCTCICIYAMT